MIKGDMPSIDSAVLTAKKAYRLRDIICRIKPLIVTKQRAAGAISIEGDYHAAATLGKRDQRTDRETNKV